MAYLHQPYSEIMAMDAMRLRGIVDAYLELKDTPTRHTPASGDNVGDVSDEDLDTSMWFK